MKSPDPMAEDELDKILNKMLDFSPRRVGRELPDGSFRQLTGVQLREEIRTEINAYTTNKIIEAREGGLDKPSDTAPVGGNQVVDPILVSELFKMVYQWGKFGVVVDSSAPAFQEQLKEVIGSIK
jgi:hypothetical protein